MKYVMFKTPDGRHIPIIFPDALVHADVAIMIHDSEHVRSVYGGALAPVSAGTYSSFGGTAAGSSETLEIASHPDDERHIRMFDYNHGITDTI